MCGKGNAIARFFVARLGFVVVSAQGRQGVLQFWLEIAKCLNAYRIRLEEFDDVVFGDLQSVPHTKKLTP